MYDLPRPAVVTLTIYDILGREVVRLVNGYRQPGIYETRWNGRNSSSREVPSGIYIARLDPPEYTRSIKMVLLK